MIHKKITSFPVFRLLVHMILATGICLVSIQAQKMHWVQSIELGLYDFKMRFFVREPANPQIVIACIDAASLDELGSYPIKRDIYAEVLNRLQKYGARFVALDISFAQPSPFPKVDQQLEKALAANQNVMLAAALTSELNGEERNYLPIFNGAWYGLINYPVDEDDKIRRLQLLIDTPNIEPTPMSLEGKYLPHLTLQILRKLDPVKGEALKEKYRDQPIGIRFAGPANSYSWVPFYYLYELGTGKLSKTEFQTLTGSSPETFFHNKIVMIGSATEILHDNHATPFFSMPGVEILANSLNTLLNDNPYLFVPDWQEHLSIAMLVLLMALLMVFMSPFWELAFLIGLSVVYAGLNIFYLFLHLNQQMALFSPLMALFLVYGTLLIKDRLWPQRKEIQTKTGQQTD